MANVLLFVILGPLSQILSIAWIAVMVIESFPVDYGIKVKGNWDSLKDSLPQTQKNLVNSVSLTNTVLPNCPPQFNAILSCQWKMSNIWRSSLMFHLLLPPNLSGNDVSSTIRIGQCLVTISIATMLVTINSASCHNFVLEYYSSLPVFFAATLPTCTHSFLQFNVYRVSGVMLLMYVILY